MVEYVLGGVFLSALNASKKNSCQRVRENEKKIGSCLPLKCLRRVTLFFVLAFTANMKIFHESTFFFCALATSDFVPTLGIPKKADYVAIPPTCGREGRGEEATSDFLPWLLST